MIKVGLSPSKKIVICLIESPLKMMNNVFYFILKHFFILKIFKACVRYFFKNIFHQMIALSMKDDFYFI